jgi:hypothetical protein
LARLTISIETTGTTAKPLRNGTGIEAEAPRTQKATTDDDSTTNNDTNDNNSNNNSSNSNSSNDSYIFTEVLRSLLVRRPWTTTPMRRMPMR